MKVEIFTEGIGRVIASGYAMRHCISFLKSVYPKRFRWIKKDGVDFDMVYAVNYKLRDKWIDEAMKTNHQEIKSDVDCPNCADQASIAAPGQTTLCKTHEDEKHFRKMKFQVICSTADGNQTKDFSNWEDAHYYANEWMNSFTHWNHRHFNNVESSEYVNLWKTRNGETVKIQEMKLTEVPKESEIHPTPLPYEIENCPNCADQASIAAPGQTTLCKTHEDEKHFREMKEFFDEYIQEIILKPHMSFCSRCGANSPDYILLLHTSGGSSLNFAACTNCRDELTLKQNAARAAQERIGA
jgi:hypothetical protein